MQYQSCDCSDGTRQDHLDKLPCATMEEFGIDYTKRDAECVSGSVPSHLLRHVSQGCGILCDTPRNGWA